MNPLLEFATLFAPIATFSEADLSLAEGQYICRSYQAKDAIFSMNETPQDVHFLLEGIGRYYYIDQHGKESNKGLVRKGGAFVSIASLMGQGKSPFYTQALTPCRILSIPYRQIRDFGRQNPNWNDFIIRYFELLTLKKERREADLLLLSASERYERFLTEFGDEAAQIPLRHVALYLGITDVSLSRIRKQMGLT